MKELLLQYAGYNTWANKQFIDLMLRLPVGAIDKEINSSFPSIRATVYHSWGAEDIWMQRLMLAEHPTWTPADFTGSFEEACVKWGKVSHSFGAFVTKQFNDASFFHVLSFYDRQKKEHKMPVFQVLNHVFNHATYHRGQLTTMLRQLGETKIPATDFFVFANGKK